MLIQYENEQGETIDCECGHIHIGFDNITFKLKLTLDDEMLEVMKYDPFQEKMVIIPISSNIIQVR